MSQLKIPQPPLPLLDGLSPDVIAELENLALLPEDSLRAILVEMVPVKIQRQISSLLQKQQADTLTKSEQKQLAMLQKQADLVMFRKAYAAALLHHRGHHLPTLEELQSQMLCN